MALERAADVQSTGGISLPRALVSLGYAREDAITAAIAHGLNLEHLGPDPPPVPPEAYDLLPAAFCRQRKVAPLSNNGRVFRLAIVDPLDYFTIQDVEFRTRKQVACVVTDESTLEDLIQKIYGKRLEPDSPTVAPETAAELEMRGEDENYDLGNEAALASNANMPPVVKLVNQFIGRAVKSGASDIHVEPQEDFLQVRRRVDGNLQDLMRIPRDLQDATLSRLKIMAGMDIADRRRPQDGRARVRYNAKFLDLRVSTLPTQYGEKVVLRILDSGKQQMPIEALGLSPSNLDVLQSLLSLPQGMILVTGPTGSGKTFTLYTSLNWVQSPANNIITVEDPIEYRLAGINQVQINTKAGVTFAAGLRSILRRDPNIIMVGEIRDRETAAIAVEASQTGHLLLSTLHTNNAPATITRLVDLGIEPYMVASSVVGILAQRLVRRPCPSCSEPKMSLPELLDRIGAVDRPHGSDNWVEGRGVPPMQGFGI